MRGNIVVNVAVIIGGAFKAIIDSLVNDIISIIAMVANTEEYHNSFDRLGSHSNQYRCFHRCYHQLSNRRCCIVLNR